LPGRRPGGDAADKGIGGWAYAFWLTYRADGSKVGPTAAPEAAPKAEPAKTKPRPKPRPKTKDDLRKVE
jgi:hypothetical protein